MRRRNSSAATEPRAKRPGRRHEARLDGEHISLFVAGRGLVSLHLDEHVYELLCERGDLLTLPAGTRHWLDFGEPATVGVIRLHKPAQGDAIQLTGDAIASQFSRLEEWT